MHDSLWQAVLGEIELSVSRGNFLTWFKNTKLLRKADNQLVIGVPNVFIKNQLEKKYADLISGVLIKNGIEAPVLEFKIHATLAPSKQKNDDLPIELTLQSTTHTTTTPRPQSTQVGHAYRQGLNERYTFETFVVGSGNELAYAACQAIAKQPGTKYNPLFLYGGVGIGKTHLIQAVGNDVLADNPNARIVYVSCEQFVQEFLDAIRFKQVGSFANHYRSADVLIVDDIQFIAGKEKTQEEFFHTFNALHQANKQIIISSDKPPRDIPTLEARLRTRFEMGMAIDMQTPDFETRCAILQMKAQTHDMQLPANVVEYVANLAQSNVRELEGLLNQLLAHCEMRSIEPDIETVTALFGSHQALRPKHLNAKAIIEKTARYFSISLEDLLGPKRDKDIVVPRQVAMFLLREELHLSFPKIAQELGRKDHTTAIHSIEKISKERALDETLKNHLQAIKERLYA